MTGIALTVMARGEAEACAPAPPLGMTVSILDEEALIVWDRERGLEHFIRRAGFETEASDFGFLVPTPTQPNLSEVEANVFDRIHTRLQPRLESRNTYWPVPCSCVPYTMFFTGGGDSAPLDRARVRVLDEARVAGMDATVLSANDTDSLARWLRQHDYPMRPGLTEWLRPYVEEGFAITAFRYVRSDVEDPALHTRAIRMTFRTDAPFYPYREPSDGVEADDRDLWLSVVSTQRAYGRLSSGEAWTAGEAVLASPLESPEAVLGDALGDLSGPLWLTVLHDRSTRRADADLRLTFRAGDPVEPPTYTHENEVFLPIPFELLILAGGVVWWRRRRRRKGLAPASGDGS